MGRPSSINMARVKAKHLDDTWAEAHCQREQFYLFFFVPYS
jgi:hypothetical protein